LGSFKVIENGANPQIIVHDSRLTVGLSL